MYPPEVRLGNPRGFSRFTLEGREVGWVALPRGLEVFSPLLILSSFRCRPTPRTRMAVAMAMAMAVPTAMAMAMAWPWPWLWPWLWPWVWPWLWPWLPLAVPGPTDVSIQLRMPRYGRDRCSFTALATRIGVSH